MTNLSTNNWPGVEVVRLDGEIDMSVAPKVRETLLDVFEKADRAVVVDLHGVSYMDSSGIATLVEGLQWSRREGKRFILLGVQQAVMGTLKLAKLDDFFEIYPSDQELSVALSDGRRHASTMS